MADLVTIAGLATAGGTLVLAVATFGATRSANRAARVAERSLLIGLRPTLMPSRPEDPPVDVDFAAGARMVRVPPGGAVVVVEQDHALLAIALRNVGAGLAVLRGWHAQPGHRSAGRQHTDPDEFRPLMRDLYVAAGDTGFWQGAIRDPADPLLPELREAIAQGEPVSVEVLYADQEGGQRLITRFTLRPGDDGPWLATAGRHWTLDV